MTDRKRIDAFEMWCWRKLLRIPWTDRVTNREVLDRIKPGLSLEAKITRLRLTYFGHVMRVNSLEKSIMVGMVSGTKRRNTLAQHHQSGYQHEYQAVERSNARQDNMENTRLLSRR